MPVLIPDTLLERKELKPIMILFKILLLILPHLIYSSILIEKAALIANTAFKEFITSIVWQHAHSDEVAEFIKQFRGCALLTPMQDGNNAIIQEFNKNRSYTQTVFIAANVQELEYFIHVVNKDLVSPIRLIVLLTEPVTYSEMAEVMKISWENDVADMLLVNSNAEDVSLTTYFPYSNGKCGDTTPVHLDHDATILFPKKFQNFHGCGIRASLLHVLPYSILKFENNSFRSLSGIEGNILNILFTVLNASMNVVAAERYGGTGAMVNSTATGSFAHLVNKKADVLCPALLMTLTRFPYVQSSYCFEVVSINWFGPKREERNDWLRILQPFMSQITIAIFTTFVVFVAASATVRRFGAHRSFTKNNIVFQSFIILLGQEVQFEKRSWLTNSMFLLWIWFCMVVRIAYQGEMVRGLQTIILESPLRTFETAVKVVDGYGGIDTFRGFLKGTPYYNGYELINFENNIEYLYAMEAGKSFLLLTDRLVGTHSAPSIQVLYDDPVSQGPISFHMRPGWPAVAEINDLIMRMIEAGLVEKIYTDYFWELSGNKYSKNRHTKPLTLASVNGCFYGLGVLYAVCILALFTEIAHHRITQNQNNTTLRLEKVCIN